MFKIKYFLFKKNPIKLIFFLLIILLSINAVVADQIIENKIKGEFGTFEDINATWSWVPFSYSFEEIPVVIHTTEIDGYNYEGGLGGNGDFSCLTRITNVSTTGFYVRLDNWDGRSSFYDPCPTGGNSNINLDFLAMVQGSYYLADNTTLVEVRNVSRNGGADCGHKGDWVHTNNNLNFNNTYTFTPYVFSSVQTTNDDDEINVYMTHCTSGYNVEYDSSCVQVGLNGMEPSSGSVCTDHTVAEEVGLIIWGVDSSQTDVPDNGITGNSTQSWKWSAVRSADEVRGIQNDPAPSNAYPTSYDSSFGTDVTVITSMIRIDGADGFVPIIGDKDQANDRVRLLSLEDENGDDEQAHTPEIFKILVFNATTGFIYGNETIDYTAPVITNVNTTSITASNALVTWDTDELANSTVNYGNTTSFSSKVTDNTLVSFHSIPLSGLDSNMTYFYNVTSCDSSGNCTTLGIYNFTTSFAADTEPPAVYNVTNDSLTETSITINWNTDENANSTVEYGTTPALGQTSIDDNFVNFHEVALSNLINGTLYYYNVTSCDLSGNCNTTGPYTFTTIPFYLPIMTLNQPLNLSIFDENVGILLNTTVIDKNLDLLCVEIYGGDQNPPLDTQLLYSRCNVTNGSILLYNWTAPVRQDTDDIDCLYHFDERSKYGESDILVNDFGGGCNDATCSGGTCPTFNMTKGKFAGAYYYNGNNYWELGADALFDQAYTDHTVELWFNAETISGTTFRMLFEEGGSVNGMNIYIYDGAVYAGAWCENCGNSWQGNWLNKSTTANEWHYVALIFDGNNNLTMVYDDQFLTISLNNSMNGHSGNNQIGRSGGSKVHTGDIGSGYYYTGLIDEFVVYDEIALTISDAIGHYRLNPNTYYWFGNVSDNKFKTSSDIWQFNISNSTPPSINLISPTNNILINDTNNISFSVFITDNSNLKNCTLFHNISGSWEKNETKIVSGTSDQTSWYIPNVPFGSYIWNTNCCDKLNNCAWNNTNYTFSVDTFDIYHEFYGNTTGLKILGRFNYSLLDLDNGTVLNIHALDYDSDISWNSLQAIGRKKDNTISSNDFIEIDQSLNSSKYLKDINFSYSLDGSLPKEIRAFRIYLRQIENVPISVSTNSSSFVTGILWDSSDSTDDEFDSSEKEDLIFITQTNFSKRGKYGQYDYEIKVPEGLGSYKGNNNLVSFYLELE